MVLKAIIHAMAFYAPESILVTGGAGFIASHVVVHLVEKYPSVNVVVVDKLDASASLCNLAAVTDRPNFKFVKGDVQSGDLMSYLIDKESIDTVMHFAAQTHVDSSFGNSISFTMNNTLGTHVLLEACRKAGEGVIKRFINVSTDADCEIALQEDGSCLAPTNPYSAAKVGAEMLCRAYMTSYGVPVIITRGNNVYGPRQYPEKAIPKFIMLASRGHPLPVHGTGASVRSYLYVDDVVDAFDCILHRGATGETYNIGTEQERSVLEVAWDICRYFDVTRGIRGCVSHVADRAFNDRRYFIGSQKLQQLGWSQQTPWNVGLKKTINWYMSTDTDAHWPCIETQ